MAQIDVDALEIRQDTSEGKFYLDMKGSAEAYLKYDLHTDQNPNVVEFTETHIPDELEGIGLDKRLAMEGMLFCEKTGYRIYPTCPTFNGHFSKHPEFHYLRAKR